MKSENIEINPIISWWISPKLPYQHIIIHPEKRPKKLLGKIRLYFRKWVFHPVKRRVARNYLKLLKKSTDIKVVGITGSAGKTTTKEMISSILSKDGKTVASYANIDPVYNIPMSILKCRLDTKYLVLEMGVEFPGEMEFYLWLAEPDIGVITNIFPTHTEFFSNKIGVMNEKSKLVKNLKDKDYAVLNSEDEHLVDLKDKIAAETLFFGEGGKISGTKVKYTSDMSTNFVLNIDKSKFNVRLPILGKQFVNNALAAAAVGYILGIKPIKIKSGLERYHRSKHRMKVLKLNNGALVIDDSYNNNPEAAIEAINVFYDVAGGKKKYIVFGDMLELGKLEKSEHKRLGRYIANLRPDYLIGVGKASEDIVKIVSQRMGESHTDWASDSETAYELLKPKISKDSALLIKGSRSIGLDSIINKLNIKPKL